MASFSTPQFVYKQYMITPPYPDTDVSGKCFCVTGGNTGLGKEAVRHLVRLNAAKVILTSRDVAKGEAAKADIETTTSIKGVVEVWTLDLQDYSNVAAFSSRLEKLERLDGIVENAAVVTPNFKIVAGYESIITVNVISTFLLAVLVLPILRKTAQRFNVNTTLTIINSEVHFMTSFPQKDASAILEACNDPKSDMSDRYPLSKLLGVYAAREISSSCPVDRDRVIVNYVNPGFCHSELSRDVQTWSFWLFKALLARSTEVGSRTLVHAVTRAGLESHGQYLDDCKVTPPARLVREDKDGLLQRRVWDEIKAELEKIKPGATSSVV